LPKNFRKTNHDTVSRPGGIPLAIGEKRYSPSRMKNFFQICLFFVIPLAAVYQPSLMAQKESLSPDPFPDPKFEHLTIADGLPENSIWAITQDHLGYLWFGTQNGLVRYDGYKMKIYQPDPNDSLSISHRQIYAIYEDRSGNLWLGTGVGLNYFDRATETFTRFVHDPDDSTSINANYVTNIYDDKAGNLFVGTGTGLSLLDRETKTFKHIYFGDSVSSIGVRAFIEDRLTGNFYVAIKNTIMILDTEKKILNESDVNTSNLKLGTINSFFQSADGSIWIGHSLGLAFFNTIDNSIKYYQPVPSLEYKRENDIGQLTEDDNGFIWGAGPIGFNVHGLVCFNPANKQFKIYNSAPDKPNSLSRDNVSYVYKDNSGILWVGTGWGGLNKWDKHEKKFKHFTNDPVEPKEERFNIVYSLTENPDGVIWFGTDRGLFSFNRFTNVFQNYRYTTKDKNNTVTSIYSDNAGIIWFGTVTKGLGRFNPVAGSFRFYSNDPNDSSSISHNLIRCILPEDNNVLWIGTRGGGINRFNKKTGNFISYMHDPKNHNSLSQNDVNCIYKDLKGQLWVGTNWMGGLNLFDRANKSFKLIPLQKNQKDKQKSLTGPTILTIFEDSKEGFWIGTYDGGLHLFDREKGILISKITEKDGLANDLVSSILEDDVDNLWLGTANGLSRFNLETHSIRNYFTSTVYEENRYYLNSVCKISAGEMLFGTYDGFIMFHPDGIKDDPVPPQVAITKVSLFNRAREKLKIEGFIAELKELNLSYSENDLRFDYVGLHYGDPSKNQYKYKLEGFDKDWVNVGTQRNAIYTNLDAGEYVFRVTACNRDGVWNEKGASLKIIIPPPFWATWWAYLFYMALIISIIYGLRRYELNRLNWKNQSKLDEVKLKERAEMDKMKSRFFANISHEFRTPLTLILGPLEKIRPNAGGKEIQKQTNLIKRNASRLLNLVNQLLDLSKLEAGKLKLKASQGNIVSFVKGIVMSFESMAEQKDISLGVKADDDDIQLHFDRDKMAKILTNLLANAFKFTRDGGEITAHINKTEQNSVEIKLRDSGIGISENELPRLFDRFYQVDSSHTREHEGTGIGLALTKELVELHHGSISVDSKAGQWTEFTIELPLGRKHLKDDKIVEKTVGDDSIFTDSSSQAPQNDDDASEDKNIILVVEDNADVREFIRDSLGNDFQIEEAANGEQGVRKAEKFIPDLIISDVMMPKMDGTELTRKLKNDEKTSHIPIILLTAKSEQESKLEGLETGADDYLTKPFDTKELRIRIKNLISVRKKLQEKFGRGEYVPKTERKKLTNLEEQFMCKVMGVIENHLSEEEFNIEQFAEEVYMSRMQLHRKLKALTGKSASLYVRSFRLLRARKMIEEKQATISEIAYSVGFSSPAYFTRCFKKEFGFPPSELSS
jgi:signal transduction histidine kinase/ligand-binding sensor domain-containing protein/DNA-binding response OmpR family regulator